MSDTRAIANFVKMAHLRGCGSNSVTDCGEECAYEKDMAFHQLGNLTDRLENAQRLAELVLEGSREHFELSVADMDEMRRLAEKLAGKAEGE